MTLRRALTLLAVGAAAVLALLLMQFRRDMGAARNRLATSGAQVAETACSRVEYARAGDGPPVISVHGIFGGHDQGMLAARSNLGSGFTIVAPSRFGYLGSPMPDEATPEAQADALICLMDKLGIAQAPLLAVSAGATAALHAAIRHPDRVAGLVLISPNAPGEAEVALPPRTTARVMFRSNVLFWLLGRYFSGALGAIMGVPDGFEMTDAQRAEVAAIMGSILPVKPRAQGVLFDMFVSNPSINTGLALEDITAPVLVVSARDDPLALFANAQALAEAIPGAQLLAITNGGHMLLGHQDEVRNEIGAFLRLPVSP